jgi:hypothetical protein
MTQSFARDLDVQLLTLMTTATAMMANGSLRYTVNHLTIEAQEHRCGSGIDSLKIDHTELR